MASNTESKAPNLIGIASQFVRQYYTLLNKAPSYIHNFYNDDSTFIHGTIELGNERQMEPAVGKNQIESKVKELKLNDCRAKIEQIDCLETLAGGLVIQVIGELSNNGEPMRRFLQTFVLAPQGSPSKDQAARQDGDRLPVSDAGLNAQQNSSQVNQKPKFYVLNSIFRYQDDGPDSDFEDDALSVQANTSTDNASASVDRNGDNSERECINDIGRPSATNLHSRQHQQKAPMQPHHSMEPVAPVENHSKPQNHHPLTVDRQVTIKAAPQQTSNESILDPKRSENSSVSSLKVVLSQGTNTNNCTGNKTYVPEKSTDNTKCAAGSATEQSRSLVTTELSSAVHTSAPSGGSNQINQAPAARSNEPKTWANIISRNAHSTLSSTSATATPTAAASKPSSNDQNQQHSQVNNQGHHNQDQPPNQQTQQQQQVQPHQTQQQPPHLQQIQQNQQMDHGQRVPNNNRRRNNMIRKTSNKPPGGRGMKDRSRAPPTSKPVS